MKIPHLMGWLGVDPWVGSAWIRGLARHGSAGWLGMDLGDWATPAAAAAAIGQPPGVRLLLLLLPLLWVVYACGAASSACPPARPACVHTPCEQVPRHQRRAHHFLFEIQTSNMAPPPSPTLPLCVRWFGFLFLPCELQPCYCRATLLVVVWFPGSPL